MKTTPDQSRDAAATAPRPKRRLRRVLVTLGSVLAVLFILALLLPVWASTAQGRGYVLDQINRDLRGKLVVGSWSLGWFTGMNANNVALMDASGQPLLQCAHISTQLTLLSILRGNYDFGETTITQPQLFLRTFADGSSNIDRLFAEPGTAESQTRANWQQRIAHLRGAIKVEDGSLIMSAEGTREFICVQEIAGDIPIASPASPVHLSVVGVCVREQARQPISIEAGVPSLIAWWANPLVVLQDINIEAAGIPVAPLAAWAGLSPDWEQSFGVTLDRFTLQNHEPRGTVWSAPRLEARGSRGSLSLSLLMQTSPTKSIVSLMNSPDYWARVQCAPSTPADALLAYINPFIASIQPGIGTIELTLSDLQIPLDKPSRVRAAGNLSLTMAQERISPKLRGLGLTLPTGDLPVPMAVPAARFAIANERLTYERMDVQFPPARALTFSGSTSLADGSVNLLLSATTDSVNPLSSGTVRLPITGSVTNPVITLPVSPSR